MPFLGNQPSVGYSTIVKDDFTGNGSTTDFTLSKSVASANDIAVFVGNVRQEPTEAYTVNGTTLTMSAAPSSSDNFYVLHLASAITSSTVPATGTITSGMLTSGAVTSAKLDTNINVAGNLTVDTNTLYVDATNNRVGIGTSSPSTLLHLSGTVPRIYLTDTDTSTESQIAGDNGWLSFSAATSRTVFSIGGTERLRILSSGGITFNGDTAAANALDDYEEGTWTATLDGSTSGPSSLVQITAYYTKIGNIVYVTGQFSAVNNTGASGGVRVSGLPFTPNPGQQASGNVMFHQIATWAGTNTANISPFFTAGYIGFYASQQAAGWFEVTHNTTTSGYLSFSGIYKV